MWFFTVVRRMSRLPQHKGGPERRKRGPRAREWSGRTPGLTLDRYTPQPMPNLLRFTFRPAPVCPATLYLAPAARP